MSTGSGLDSQLGTKTETTVGTVVTADHFFTFDSADISYDPSYLEGQGIRAGKTFKSISQAGIARKAATGKIELPLMYKGMSWWMTHMFGASQTPAVVPSGTLAFESYFTPGGLRGKSFSTQIGKPEPSTGTVQSFNYNGCKITDWEIAWADNANTLLTVTVDAFNEAQGTPALAAATYPTGNGLFNFGHVTTFKVGGTVSTTSGKTSITSGTSVVTVVDKLTLTGKNTLATTRYGLGNGGVKKEQLEEDFTAITGSFSGEYLESEWQSQFRAGTTTALQIDSVSPNFIESSTPYLFSVILPAVKITKAQPTVSGPGLVTIAGEFTVYDPDDGVNPPMQIHIVSTDTTL
jgi:hypothetical protein